MKAIVHDRYGAPEVLHIEDVAQPVPRDREILVKIHAGTVNRTDGHARDGERGYPLAARMAGRLAFGLRAPRRRILGSEFAGEVAAAGAGATRFAIGDRVFGTTGLAFGCHAEFVCIRETGRVAHIPEGLTYEEAAPICDGALSAISCLQPAGLGGGKTILIYGASGAIGSAAVQLAARHFGAEVTAVCATKSLELMKKLGAHNVLDYTKEDFTQNGDQYSVVFDAVGKHSFSKSRDSIKPGGCFLFVDGFGNVPRSVWTRWVGDKRVVAPAFTMYNQKGVYFLAQLVKAGEYKPVIDRVYPMTEVVEAARYVDTQQKTGNVVLAVA